MRNSGKKPFARKVLPHLIQSMGMIMESDIRAAFVQVFFSAVYHLKSTVLPYASKLLKVSLKSLTDGSDKENVAGAKLMASLMASEEAILESITGGLLDARTILSSISSSDTSPDTSPEVQQMASSSNHSSSSSTGDHGWPVCNADRGFPKEEEEVHQRHTYRATNFVAHWKRHMVLRAMKITNVTEVQRSNEQAEINEEIH
ncbi:hypothetical protein Vadar_004533 [Vaccinium darrowii]|uniref:Uncharacterized protein n=1 Tax=Vaccinium darrowii TaxID=229202 RepID=A0ACB7YJ46_9ERIC|nr:hypothetical protein Vadar_004533 [Vaccinium darrowii]